MNLEPLVKDGKLWDKFSFAVIIITVYIYIYSFQDSKLLYCLLTDRCQRGHLRSWLEEWLSTYRLGQLSLKELTALKRLWMTSSSRWLMWPSLSWRSWGLFYIYAPHFFRVWLISTGIQSLWTNHLESNISHTTRLQGLIRLVLFPILPVF